MIDLPVVGRDYTWQEILNIAISCGIYDVVDVLSTHPPPGKPFRSDGCSGGCPEEWNGKQITKWCIVHDIRYWCGIMGDEIARLQADMALMADVVADTGDTDFARTMFLGVSVGGTEVLPLPWRWGYGRR